MQSDTFLRIASLTHMQVAAGSGVPAHNTLPHDFPPCQRPTDTSDHHSRHFALSRHGTQVHTL